MDTQLPHCVGFIMDGNRRWAKAQSLPTVDGHKQGADRFQDVMRWTRDAGIPHVVFYGFSTENWRRSEAEVSYLLQLFETFLQKIRQELPNEGVIVRFIGRRHDFPESLQVSMAELEQVDVPQARATVWVALSYGGRAEIVDAVNAAVVAGDSVDEATFANLLQSASMPDPDLIIRTGGEQRLSNFLTWQSVYSELMFTDTYWPAFTKEEFLSMVEGYATRQRRRGT